MLGTNRMVQKSCLRGIKNDRSERERFRIGQGQWLCKMWGNFCVFDQLNKSLHKRHRCLSSFDITSYVKLILVSSTHKIFFPASKFFNKIDYICFQTILLCSGFVQYFRDTASPIQLSLLTNAEHNTHSTQPSLNYSMRCEKFQNKNIYASNVLTNPNLVALN
jgi:hypothetical protein